MRSVILTMMILIAAQSPAIADIVTIAQGEIGKGEIGGDNKGKVVRKYTRGQDVAWCAAFVSWCRKQNGQGSNYFLSARSYWTHYGKGTRISIPRRGDIACFSRGRSGRQGHVGIVESVESKDDTTIVVLIEGNKGAYPAKVSRHRYTLNKMPNLLGFVRIPNENTIQNRS